MKNIFIVAVMNVPSIMYLILLKKTGIELT